MSDLNQNNNSPEKDEDILGLDNENILARRKSPLAASASDPLKKATEQPVQRPVKASVAPGVKRERPKQSSPSAGATRQMPVQSISAPASGQAHSARPPQDGAKQAGQQRSAQPKNAAVVPVQRKAVPAAKKQPAPVPAYAARRSALSAAPAASESDSDSKQGSAAEVISNDKAPDAGSPKAGADMMVSIVKSIIYMVLVLVVSVFISIVVIRVGNDVFAFVKSDEQIDITIPEDATTADIADILYDNGIIKYPSVFKLYASMKHEKGDYLGGTYTVSPSLSYDKLRAGFKKQIETGTCWITIPEGYTTDEIIDLMVENGIGDRETYIDVINNHDFDYWFIEELKTNGVPDSRAYRLDGYLFPDSYQFYKASSEVTVINKLLARFNEVFVEDYKTRAAELGYTVDQVLTIASMVEKEAARAADFMNVSSVFHNRLNDPYNYAKLQSDATTVYAIQIATGQRPKDVTPEDNNFESPYNTYLYEGLPPGPITNPSASAIRYALYPANTNYKYFVSAKNGTTLFAATKGEHNANIETVRQMNAD